MRSRTCTSFLSQDRIRDRIPRCEDSAAARRSFEVAATRTFSWPSMARSAPGPGRNRLAAARRRLAAGLAETGWFQEIGASTWSQGQSTCSHVPCLKPRPLSRLPGISRDLQNQYAVLEVDNSTIAASRDIPGKTARAR